MLKSYSLTASPEDPMTYILVPSGLKKMPVGRVSEAVPLYVCRKLAVLTSHATLKSYSFTSSPVDPMTYILVPSGLKKIAFGAISCAATLNVCKKIVVVKSHATLKSYSFTSSPVVPMTYILVPSGLKKMPLGADSCIATPKEL